MSIDREQARAKPTEQQLRHAVKPRRFRNIPYFGQRIGRRDNELGVFRCAPSSTPTPNRSTNSPPSQPVRSASLAPINESRCHRNGPLWSIVSHEPIDYEQQHDDHVSCAVPQADRLGTCAGRNPEPVYRSEGCCNKPAAAEQINGIEYHRGGEQS